MPASVTVGQGATSATFAIATSAVTTTVSATVSATYNGVTRTTILSVTPAPPSTAALATLSLNPTGVRGGTSSTGTVKLTAPAPAGGGVVKLVSSKPSIASVPTTITVAAGATSKTFTVKTVRPSRRSSVTISATYGGVTKTATLTVTRQ